MTPEVLAELGGAVGARVLLVRERGPLGVRPLRVARPVAAEIEADAEARQWAAARVASAAEIAHPGWARVFGAARIDGRSFVSAELVAGPSLTRLEGIEALPLPALGQVGARVAATLEALHRGHDPLGRPRRLVHGSVTPDKILVSFAGEVKLLDFGVAACSARALAGASGWPPELLPWLPPEQLDGAPPNPGGDLYMLGATLYTLLTGQPPYAPGSWVTAAARDRLAPPSRLRPDVRPSLDGLVMSLLALDPAGRPGSADEVRERLDLGPAQGLLAAAAQDGARELYARLTGLYDDPGEQIPLVHAEVVDEAAARRPTPPPRAPTPIPGPRFDEAPDGADSIEALKEDVRLLWAQDPRVEIPPPKKALPAPEVLALPAEPLPDLRPRWRGPVGMMMLLVAAIVLAWTYTPGPAATELRVVAHPAGSAVHVDGRPHPDGGRVSPGPHRIEVREPGYAPTTVTVEIAAGERRVVVIDLGPLGRPSAALAP